VVGYSDLGGWAPDPEIGTGGSSGWLVLVLDYASRYSFFYVYVWIDGMWDLEMEATLF
jgi:hypothetical protein